MATSAQAGGSHGERPIRFAPERAYAPFVFDGPDGRPRGLSIDMLRALEPSLGAPLQWQPSADLAHILAAAREGRVDLVSSLRPTPERSAYLAFTAPYVMVPAVLVLPAKAPSSTLEALTGARAAVGKGYAVEAHLRARHPHVHWVAQPNDEAALQALRRGEVEAWVADVASVRHLLREFQVDDLRVGAPVGFEYPLSFAYRRELTALGAALDRALRELDPAERRRIVQRWLEPEAQGWRHPGLASWQGLSAALLLGVSTVAAGVGLLRLRRRRMVAVAAASQKEDGR